MENVDFSAKAIETMENFLQQSHSAELLRAAERNRWRVADVRPRGVKQSWPMVV